MIHIHIAETAVFTRDAKEPIIYIHNHIKGRYQGHAEAVGSISFADMEQAEQFAEMIELLKKDLK